MKMWSRLLREKILKAPSTKVKLYMKKLKTENVDMKIWNTGI